MEESRHYKIYILTGILFQSRNKYSWETFRKVRLICGVTNSVAVYIIKRNQVRSPEGHIVSEDIVLPWPLYNAPSFVLCIFFSGKIAKWIIYSALRDES